MIKFSATNALVHSVTPVIEIESRSGGQPFCKRELIIDDSWEKDGKLYTNFVSVPSPPTVAGEHPSYKKNLTKSAHDKCISDISAV